MACDRTSVRRPLVFRKELIMDSQPNSSPTVNNQSPIFTTDHYPSSRVQPMQPRNARLVFPEESDLERRLLNDVQALQALADAMGIHIGDIRNQVKSMRDILTRADLVSTGSTKKKSRSIIELMLKQLDSSHIYQAFVNALLFSIRDVTFVATSFPEHTKKLLSEIECLSILGGAVRFHLIQLHTAHDTRTGEMAFAFTPVAFNRSKMHPRVRFLRNLQHMVHAQGDDSLLDCAVTRNRRMESYTGLGFDTRIRIDLAQSSARFSIISVDPQARKHLRALGFPHRLQQLLIPHGLDLEQGANGDVVTVASFKFSTEWTDAPARCLEQLAHVYRLIRLQLRADLDQLKLTTPLSQRIKFDPNLRPELLLPASIIVPGEDVSPPN